MSLGELSRGRIRERRVRSHKGSDWKDCSHEGRALLYCVSVLKEEQRLKAKLGITRRDTNDIFQRDDGANDSGSGIVASDAAIPRGE
jgi:hypothetical protein